MLFTAANVNPGAYVMYVGNPGQQQYLPLYLNAPPAIQTVPASMGLPVIFTQSPCGSSIQQPQPPSPLIPPLPPSPFRANIPQAVVLSPSNTFFPFTADVGVPFAAPYTPYIVPVEQTYQPVRETPVEQALRDPQHLVPVFSPDAGLVNVSTNKPSNLDGSSCNAAVEQSKGVNTKEGRSSDISGVRNFLSPMGSVLERGRSTRMNVPPLARRRPPPCRIPQRLLDTGPQKEV
ncbi:uncharacterized protein TM35_000013370 [Trypanosoma theileri]|uniref:Uncharacterized protein n=1 Tax=Trypanosoma theileri TaxID=67003 RepID=A0A1X0PAH8_9TRYP|nr:uncharacterized protein TM35_000013370 [Trypanosoma theileri]ORC93460.1 hypothetical protein TM35_000013370 [Trypanosoma theileri]